MPNLYAICRPVGGLEVRLVQLNQQVQTEVVNVIQFQEVLFNDGIQNEIDFTGDWKPDKDELLVIRALPEVQTLLGAVAQNAVALQPVDVNNFLNQNIVGLFTTAGVGQNLRLLVQNFSAQQILQTKLALMFDGNVFRKITEPAFTVGNHLTAVINAAGEIRFKSYSALRRVLDVAPVFQQATDAELNAFCAHASLAVANAQGFVGNADEGIRKQVHAITRSEVLAQHTVPDIEAKAADIGFALGVTGGRIEVPPDRKNAKELFSFLLNKVYRGPINQQLFITNSNRPL
ncbi:hypothetical protein [Brevundimonas sp.]|uniref:hypothetical protein n=1 Tax=Brevundimonas sp. TaxID=1871086 RepID=UPI003F709251